MIDAPAGRTRALKLRDKLFLSYALLSIAILAAAAWIIESQVVAQARQQVQQEMTAALPVYEAVWEEQAVRLSAVGMAMAGSPIAKTIFGDARASRNAETIRQMLLEFGQPLSRDVDLVVVTDGGGHVLFADSRGPALPALREFHSARVVSENQKPAESVELVGGRLFHLALAPVVSHSGNAQFDNTLAVLVAGIELDRQMAEALKARANSDVLFFAGSRLYSSSLVPGTEATAAQAVAAGGLGDSGHTEPAGIVIAGETHLAFARPLESLDAGFAGRVVVLRSLSAATRLFRAISTRLVMVGAIAIVVVLLVSYYIARRITSPIEALALGAREFGRGNYDHPIDLPASGEVGQLASTFEQMRLSVRQGQAILLRNERLATIGQMASGIIHDLRSPLAAISTAAEVFASSELPPAKRQALACNQLQASHRMQRMLRELLEFALGKYALKRESVELAPFIRSVTGEALSSMTAQGVTMDVEVPPGIVVYIDSDHAGRLLTNLLVNSLQAMPGGGVIRIRADRYDGRARINVADTGAGIPTELRERLFEPFASHGKEAGTGLGLAIASSIAEAHGGSLTLVSGFDQPAEFRVELPLAPQERRNV